jgi:uncharacterized membrane protein
MSELPVRRRLERRVVQVQARLEAGSGDRWIPTTATLLLGGALMAVALARVESYGTGVDLGGYSQTIWLLGRGYRPEASLLGADVHVLELHWSFILYPLAVLGRAFDPPRLLVATQAVALALAVPPLWLLARRVASLRIGAATALVLAYGLHPATHELGTSEFHPEAMAVPALLGMAYFGATKRWILYWLCIALALACRADLGLAVALWGFVALGNRERSVGVWTLGVGLAWSLGLLLVVQPLISDGGVVPGTFGTDGTTLGEVVLSSLRDPLQTVQDLLSEDNIELIVSLLAPLIFLPLLSMRYLAPALPLAVLYLIADIPPDQALAERSAMLLAFMMIAATYALNRLGNMGVDRVFLDARILSTLVAGAVLLYVSTSPISPYARPWTWDERDGTDLAVAEAVALLGDEVPVRASPSALAALSQRPWVFALDPGREPSAAQAGFPNFTRAMLVVDREIPERTASDRQEFDRAMELQGYEVMFVNVEAGVTLYARD